MSTEQGLTASPGWTPPNADEVQRRLTDHLRLWLGAWPPVEPFQLVGHGARALPGWDERIHPVVGVVSPQGTVLSVPPAAAERLAGIAHDRAAVEAALREVLDRPSGAVFEGVFRWSVNPPVLPDLGIWLPSADPRVPEWLWPFGGEVLVALDANGRYMAGVGIKKHDRYGHELAVVTDPAYYGQGLARRLVAKAARAVLDRGSVPTYLHADSNVASGRVAEAAGFPDRGWKILGFWEPGNAP